MDDQHKSVIRDIKNGKYDTTPNDPRGRARVFNDKPLDQAILEYLPRRATPTPWRWSWTSPWSPGSASCSSSAIRARLCVSQNPVAGAEVTVRVLSSLKKAGTLATGRTDVEGLFSAKVELPPSQPGHCAVLIACTSEFGSDELRALITA